MNLIDQAFATDPLAIETPPRKIVICTHAKFSSLELCRVLLAAGHEVIFFPVDYSKESQNIDLLLQMGVEVIEQSQQLIPALGQADGIIEDGARLSKIITQEKITLKQGFFSVEQTSGGIRYFEEHPPMYPVVNVAMSPMKLDLENRRATPEGVIEQFAQATGKTFGGQRVLIVGFGSIGEGLARLIRTLGGQVTVFDVFATRRLFAKHRGYAVIEPDEFDQMLSTQDVVFMATNTYQGDALGVEQLLLMKDGAIICNAGSGRGELAIPLQQPGTFSIHDTEGTIEIQNRHLVIRFKKHEMEKTITVLGEAYPINLHLGPGTSHDVIEFVMTLLLLAALRGPAHTKEGIQPLAQDISEHVAQTALSLHRPNPSFSPVHIRTRTLPMSERPYGGVSPFHTSLNDVAHFSVARALFRSGSKTRGHYHRRSQEAYMVERGVAHIAIWHKDHPEDRQKFVVEAGDYLLVPENHFHDVMVPGAEDFECLVVASPPFSFWDQFFSTQI